MNNTVDRGSFTPDDISHWFWDVIEKSKNNRDQLDSMLQEMSREEIIRFDSEFQEAATQLVDEPFFEFMEQDISEDEAKDIADWVVSQGKEFYSMVWSRPEQIPARADSSLGNTLTGVAERVFWERFHEPIPQETS